MNKQELIESIATGADITKSAAAAALDSFTAAVTKTLQNGGEVAIVGFGTFKTSHRKARMGLNPQTKQPLQIPEATVPKFKAGKHLKEAVNK